MQFIGILLRSCCEKKQHLKCRFVYPLRTTEKPPICLGIFTEISEPFVVQRYTLYTVLTGVYSAPRVQLLQRETAHRVFADAAEVEGAVVFDRVCDLGEAVWGTVLEVFDDAAALVEAEDE